MDVVGVGRRVFFFQAEDGIRDLVRSRGLGDVYKRQVRRRFAGAGWAGCERVGGRPIGRAVGGHVRGIQPCLLYTSDAADDLLCVDLGGRRIIKKKTTTTPPMHSLAVTLHRA